MTKVLVVDDERSVRRVLVQTLLDAGYEVVEAKDGGVALEIAFQEQPDVILLDIMMPVLDGFEVLKQLREDPGTGDIPVVLLSALPVLDGEQNGLKLGAAQYITKPWRQEQLERTVRVAIRGRAQISEGDLDGDNNEVKGGDGGPGRRSGHEGTKENRLIRTADLLVPLEKRLDGGLLLGTDDLEAEGDPRLLRVVLENLFRNAWKFTSAHEIAHIQFGLTKADGKSAYFISDDGAGFDMAYADKLFGAFQRLHSTDEFEGTGIGLATVQRIIHRHGGRIWANGQVDAGAAFYFTI